MSQSSLYNLINPDMLLLPGMDPVAVFSSSLDDPVEICYTDNSSTTNLDVDVPYLRNRGLTIVVGVP